MRGSHWLYAQKTASTFIYRIFIQVIFLGVSESEKRCNCSLVVVGSERFTHFPINDLDFRTEPFYSLLQWRAFIEQARKSGSILFRFLRSYVSEYRPSYLIN